MRGKFLIIDDSALMRRVISDIIRLNSECEILDVACDGLQGFDKLVSHPSFYDLVILDINMPKMNGLEMLEMLHKNNMHENVVVVSTVAKEGTKETLRALELGALDFVTKPENFYEVRGEGFKTTLLGMIDLVLNKQVNRTCLTASNSVTHYETVPKVSIEEKQKQSFALANSLRGVKKGHNKLVAIACSTGGPKSLQDVIPLLPANLDAGVLLVQHMPKGFTASLAMRLNGLGMIKVSEAVDGEVIEKGHVYIAPGGRHMRAAKQDFNYVIRLSDEPAVDGLRPCANIMYESLKDTDFDEITCVVLTGMGADGTNGIKTLSKAHKNIHVISQNEETCVVYGMPRTIAEAGLSDEVVPLHEIAERIIKNVGVS